MIDSLDMYSDSYTGLVSFWCMWNIIYSSLFLTLAGCCKIYPHAYLVDRYVTISHVLVVS